MSAPQITTIRVATIGPRVHVIRVFYSGPGGGLSSPLPVGFTQSYNPEKTKVIHSLNGVPFAETPLYALSS
jgi:hypothetical protein